MQSALAGLRRIGALFEEPEREAADDQSFSGLQAIRADAPCIELRHVSFGYVEQSFHSVAGTIAEQITLFDTAITRAQAESAVKLVGLEQTILALPMGYDTPYGEAMLSQGQLLSIARAVAADPPIMLLDEMTANLDSATENRVLTAIEQAAKGRTLVSISHRLYGRLNSRLIRMDDLSE